MTVDDSWQVTPFEDLLNGIAAQVNARIQSGSATVPIVSAGTTEPLVVVFPVAFPSTPNVTCTIRGTNSIDTRHVGVSTRTPTQVTFVGLNETGTTNVTFDWTAILP